MTDFFLPNELAHLTLLSVKLPMMLLCILLDKVLNAFMHFSVYSSPSSSAQIKLTTTEIL